jgi:hypothetical protein
MDAWFVLFALSLGIAIGRFFRSRRVRHNGIEGQLLDGHYELPDMAVNGLRLNQMAVGVVVAAVDRYAMAIRREGLAGVAEPSRFQDRANAVRELIVRKHGSTATADTALMNEALEATSIGKVAVWKASLGE